MRIPGKRPVSDKAREAIEKRRSAFSAFCADLSAYAKLVENGKLKAPHSIKYVSQRSWAPKSWTWLRFGKHTAEGYTLYSQKNKDVTWLIFVTKDGDLISSIAPVRNQWVMGPNDNRRVEVDKIDPVNIQPDEWGQFAVAAARLHALVEHAE